ncbi:MAG: hypothetical protein C5B51_00110 [Terriglobia bacterium]|nr:MAG: hypothetical protein C5B51_00110 [Terriglobia bacterium]
MAEILDLKIEQSSDVVHVGDDFLIYLTVRNLFDQPITSLAVSYDVPKGLLIRDEEANRKSPSGWLSSIVKALRDYMYIPSVPEPVFGKTRSIRWTVNIQPEETYTLVFPVRAGAFFPPSLKPDTYHLLFDIEFHCGSDHSQQVRTDLIVYAHRGGIFLGATLGGALGAFLQQPQTSLPGILVASLSGLALAVVFRRKANVQSLIAIEDFWGGFVIGLAGGYGGQQVLAKFLVPGGTGPK